MRMDQTGPQTNVTAFEPVLKDLEAYDFRAAFRGSAMVCPPCKPRRRCRTNNTPTTCRVVVRSALRAQDVSEQRFEGGAMARSEGCAKR
jgi:hypothetical protein